MTGVIAHSSCLDEVAPFKKIHTASALELFSSCEPSSAVAASVKNAMMCSRYLRLLKERQVPLKMAEEALVLHSDEALVLPVLVEGA